MYIFNETSMGHNFFQEMPACAIDDAITPVGFSCFALRFGIRLEQFKQLYVAHVLNHLLCRRTERVVGFVLLQIALKSMFGKGGSRYSRPIQEHESFQLASEQFVAILESGSQSSPRSALITRFLGRDLRHGRQRVSPFYHDLFRLQR